MSLEIIISLSSGIIAWITTLIVLFTLLEMKRQRKDSIKPDIVIVNQIIYARITNNSCIWSNTEFSDKEIDNGNTCLEKNFYLQLYNIGLNSAKNLTLKWTFDIANLVKTINKSSHKQLNDLYIEFTNNRILEFKSKNGINCVINIDNELKNEFPYILPASISKEGLCCPLPISIILLSSYYYKNELFSELDNHTENNELNEEVNNIQGNLSIEYFDVNNHKYKIKHQFELNLYHFETVDKNQLKVVGSFSIR